MPIPSPSVASGLSGLSERFSGIVQAACRAAAVRLGRHPDYAPAWMALWHRLTWVARRFAALAEQARAGTLKPARRWPGRSITRNPPTRSRQSLPRGFGWLAGLGPPAEVSALGGQLHHLLTTDPEAIALLQAAPQLQRYLRPLARMLGAPPIPALLPPPREPRSVSAARPRTTPTGSADKRSAIRQPRAPKRAGWRSPDPPRPKLLS